MEVKIVLAPETKEGLKVSLTCDYGENMHEVLKKLMYCASLSDNDTLLTFKDIDDKWTEFCCDEDADNVTNNDELNFNITPEQLSEFLNDSAELIERQFDDLIDAQLKDEINYLRSIRSRHPLNN